MTKTLEMTFRTAGGNEVVMSLPEPKDSLALAEVQTAMQTIITKNLFSTNSGDLAQIVDAKVRVVDVTTLA